MSTEYNTKFVSTGIATRTIHADQEPGPTTDAVVTPTSAISAFKQDGMLGLRGGHDHSRSINPTRTSFDERLAAVEDGKYALSFSSGLTAIDVPLRPIIKSGDNILFGNDVYGGIYCLLSKVFVPWGIGLDVVDITDLKAAEATLAPRHYQYAQVETPSNPSFDITDITATTEVTHKHGIKIAVDNTFTLLALQYPLAGGADVVVYSVTKYTSGHSDVVGGAMVVNDRETRGKITFLQNTIGAVPSPFDSWLNIHSLRTLDLRIKHHSANALKVAEWLESQSSDVIERVWHPGLEPRPGHEIVAHQMYGDFDDIISVQLAADAETAKHFVDHTQIFAPAGSLGSARSLTRVPAAMAHASVVGTTLRVPASLARISVGVESTDDLIVDLKQALDRI